LVKFPFTLPTHLERSANNESRSLSGCGEFEPSRQKLQAFFATC
jgi:hypothetical protein